MEELDSCIWHADSNEVSKSVEALREARAPPEIREQNSAHSELLDGAKLSGLDLKDRINFYHVALRESDLRDADFSDANLNRADLSNASLMYIDFSNANLTSADLSNANLTSADLSNANLTNADLSNTNLTNADLSNANLDGADLPDTILTNADLSDANLDGADLSNASLEEADFSGANLRGAYLPDVSLINADLPDADLQKGDLTDTDLRGADLSDASLMHIDLSDADLMYADLSDANLWDADLSSADLRGAKLSNVHLVDADLSNADLQEAVLQQADVNGTDFISSNLAEASLVGADCESAEFENAVLVRASLENADLVDTNLTSAYLFGAQLGGARIDSATQLVVEGGVGDVTVTERCRYDPDAPPEGPEASLAMDPEDLKAPPDSPRVIQLRRARSVYQRLERLGRQNGFPTLQSRMFKRRQEMRRHLLREQGERTRWLFAELQRGLFVYGESFRRVLSISALVVSLFWGLFTTTGTIQTTNGTAVTAGAVVDDQLLVWETLYHSLSVFFAGTGPLSPTGTLGQILTISLRATGPILLALLIFVLGRRAAR